MGEYIRVNTPFLKSFIFRSLSPHTTCSLYLDQQAKTICFWKINNIVVKIWERWSINKYEELKSNIPLHHFFFSCSWSNNKCLKLTSVLGGTSAYIQVNIPTPENIKRVVQCMRLPPWSRKHYPICRKAICNTRTRDHQVTTHEALTFPLHKCHTFHTREKILNQNSLTAKLKFKL